jgi:DNA-binding MarR family transcriptional regulator
VRAIAADPVRTIQDAWRRERPDIDVSSIGILTRALLIGRHLSRARDVVLRDLGTDASTLDVLATLRRAGNPYQLRASELAVATRVSAGAISQRLDRLERRGLINRNVDGKDRRGVLVNLTAEGRDLIDATVAGLTQRESLLLTPLGSRERVALERLLTRWLWWLDEQPILPPEPASTALARRQLIPPAARRGKHP